MSSGWANEVPESLTVGDPAAGHAVFDAEGVTFYGTDGVTELFRFDFATGALTFSSRGTGERIALLADQIDFYTASANSPVPPAIIRTGLQSAGFADEQPWITIESPREPGRNASGLTAYGDKANALGTSELNLGADTIILGSFGAVVKDWNGSPFPRGNSGLINVNTDAAGSFTFAHGLTVVPSAVLLTDIVGPTQPRVTATTNTTATVAVRNQTGTALLANTALSYYFLATA